MSAISSVGTSTASQYADQLRRRPGGSEGGADFAAHMKSMFESAAKSAGVSDSDLPGLMDKVQKAVDTAKASGSKDPSTIKAAVEGVLKDNGVDTAKFQAAMEAQRPKGGPGGAHGHHKKPEGTEASGSTDSTQQSSSTQQTDLQKLLASLQSSSDEDAQSVLAEIKQQSTGNGTLLDVAA